MSRIASGPAAIREFYERYPCGGEAGGDERARKLPWWYEALRTRTAHGPRVIEVGCGTGVDLGRFARDARQAIGFDGALRPLRLARQRVRDLSSAQVVQADARSLPLPGCSVDACYSIGVVHHVPRWRDAVGEVARVLRPGGVFVLVVYRRWCLQSLVFALGSLLRWPVRVLLERQGRFGLGARAAAAAEFALHPHVELHGDRTWLAALDEAGFTVRRMERRDAWFPLDRILPALRHVAWLDPFFGRFLILEAQKS